MSQSLTCLKASKRTSAPTNAGLSEKQTSPSTYTLSAWDGSAPAGELYREFRTNRRALNVLSVVRRTV